MRNVNSAALMTAADPGNGAVIWPKYAENCMYMKKFGLRGRASKILLCTTVLRELENTFFPCQLMQTKQIKDGTDLVKSINYINAVFFCTYLPQNNLQRNLWFIKNRTFLTWIACSK